MGEINVLGFAGSLRKKSYNRSLLQTAAGLLPAGMSLEIFDLAPIPFYNRDVEDLGFPPAVAELRERIALADGLLIATPEYNYSIPGVLKNAIDWASRSPDSPLDGKPVAIMGAGGQFGTVRAQLHLRQIALHNSMLVMMDPEVHVRGARFKFDDHGRLTDEETVEEVRALLSALAEWVLVWRTSRPLAPA